MVHIGTHWYSMVHKGTLWCTKVHNSNEFRRLRTGARPADSRRPRSVASEKKTNIANTRPFLCRYNLAILRNLAQTSLSGWEGGPIRASLPLMRISLRVLIKPDSQQKVGPQTCKQNCLILILCSYYPL